jgi:hypothetical protein
MARNPKRLGLTRDQFASFLNDFEQIKQFESLFASVDEISNFSIDEVSIAADNAGATANDALAQISFIAQETQLLALAPPDLGGTVTSVGLSTGTTGLTVAGPNPITTSGTFTLGGTLAIANGGTNSAATPTAGGIAYGTGTAYAFSAAGTAGQFLTSTGAGTPTWSTASSPFGNPAYWGSFWDTTDQVAPAANTAYSVTLNSADAANNGTTVVSGSRVTFAHAGVYSLTFSIQFVNTDTQIHDVNVWLRKNDSGSSGDIPDSDTKLSIQQKHGGVDGYGLMTVNFVLSLAAGDYIEMIWATTNTAVSIQSVPAGTSPVSPAIPGVIFTAVSAPHIGIGYAGVASTTSMTIGTGSKTFTTNVSSTDTAFTVGNRVRLIYDATNYMEGTITAFSGTSMTVNVDTTAGSGTHATWSVGLTGVVNTGVTSFSGGSTGLTPATATSGAVTLAGTLGVGYGGTGTATSFTAGSLVFAGASGVYSQDNANLNWDDTNNTLGVGRAAAANVRIYSKGGTTGSGAFQFYGENSASTGCFGVRDDGGFFTGLAASSPYNLTTASAPNVFVGSDGYLYRSTASVATGTVTSVSVVSANGLAGTVANATTTPAITLSTTVTGLVKGNGTALSSASAGTDYIAPGAITTSGLTMATARLLGRTTASTGAVEEITVGTGLSFSAGTLSNSAPDQTVALTAGTGISVSGTYPSFTITNTAPDQIVSLTGAGTTVVTGTYPSFTITSNDQYVGTVTSVSGTGTVNGITLTGSVTSSGSLTLGGTLGGIANSQLTNSSITINGSAISLGGSISVGTVTSVSGTGSVNGITLTGSITSSGSLTLGGTLSNVSLTTQVTGTLPVTSGGTGTATAFTTGSIVFANSSGIYAQDNANFNWNNTNKTLGVGRTASSNVRVYSKGGTTGSGAFSYYGENSAGTGCFGIRDDGAFYTGAASLSPYNLTTAAAANLVVAADYYLYRSTSSARYKKNIVDYDRGLAAAMSLRPVYYEGKGEIDEGKRFAGFVAEEVYDSGLTEFVVLDEEGKPDALHYGNMTALLASAIKELGERLKRIEAALGIEDGDNS